MISITPDVNIQSSDFGESGVPMSSEITATYKQVPLKGLKVDWKVDGATIQNMDSIIDSNGKAKMTFIANSPGPVHISASVSGGLYTVTTSSKDVTINAPLASTSENTPKNNLSMLGGIDPLMLVIPVVIGIGILIFKKREMFEEMSEKFNLSE
ncbi:MAG: Ig-like domain-containing protein, partial [Thaumarchaeota archaeon]|nr:Ig-like domain-containing protein [Nitrososphaerota archaeon]